MPNPVQKAIRAVAEHAVELIATWNRKRLTQTGAAYLVGIHKPMQAELTLEDLPVIGSIPLGLNGRYLKMGANPVSADIAGTIGFSATEWCTASPSGTGGSSGIATAGSVLAWQRRRLAVSLRRAPRRGRNDTVNTNVVDIGGRAFVLVEAGSYPVELSEMLDEQRYNPFDGTLGRSFSGHPHRDPVTGEHHAVAYDGSVWDMVRHVVVSAAGKVVRDVPIAVKHGPCIHDCAITARFAILSLLLDWRPA